MWYLGPRYGSKIYRVFIWHFAGTHINIPSCQFPFETHMCVHTKTNPAGRKVVVSWFTSIARVHTGAKCSVEAQLPLAVQFNLPFRITGSWSIDSLFLPLLESLYELRHWLKAVKRPSVKHVWNALPQAHLDLWAISQSAAPGMLWLLLRGGDVCEDKGEQEKPENATQHCTV